MKAQFVYDNLSEETAIVSSLPKILPMEDEDERARFDQLRKEDEMTENIHFERTGDIRKSMGIGTIHLDLFESVIIGALEGGSNYWYMLFNEDYRDQLGPKNPNKPALSERIAFALYTNPKFGLPVYDAESEEDDPELLGTVTQESMYRAFEIAKEDYPDIYERVIEGQEDASDADVIFQLATMGELTFG